MNKARLAYDVFIMMLVSMMASTWGDGVLWHSLVVALLIGLASRGFQAAFTGKTETKLRVSSIDEHPEEETDDWMDRLDRHEKKEMRR